MVVPNAIVSVVLREGPGACGGLAIGRPFLIPGYRVLHGRMPFCRCLARVYVYCLCADSAGDRTTSNVTMNIDRKEVT